MQRAGSLCDVRRFDEARELMTTVIAAEPDSGPAWVMMAKACLGADDTASALQAAQRAAAIAPESPNPRLIASIALAWHE